MKARFTLQTTLFTKKHVLLGMFIFLVALPAFCQLGTYTFNAGAAVCPQQNPSVSSQPANAVFTNFSHTNTICELSSQTYINSGWNTTATIDLTQYNEFSVTPNTYYNLTLTSLSFTQITDSNAAGGTTWALRSSLDGYASNIATGTVTTTSQSPTVTLPSAIFTKVGAVNFRFYIINANSATTLWSIDDVTLNGTVNVIPPADPANPTSNSPQCSIPGVTITANGSAPVGETWYWQTSVNGTATGNSGATYTVNTSGTYYIRSQNNTTLVWSTGAGSLSVTVTPDVTMPVFVLGVASTRCQGAGIVTYAATAVNTTGMTYSLDAASISGGNSINAATGDVTYVAGWSGISTITATATGCNGPTTANHTVTITPAVGTPVFAIGTTSTRCQGAGIVTYTATATNNTGITYTLNASAIAGGNAINSATGSVTYVAGWTGSTIVTASANGCNGPVTSLHTVTIIPTVGTPVFILGATSTRCQGAGIVTYAVTSTNNTGITYSLDAASIAGGNSINASTGDVSYVAGWSGTSIITASAVGCNGPTTATHTVTITPALGTPVFTLGATSTRCQGVGIVTYTATATNNTGLTYSLDAASITGGNSISAATGDVTYVAGWIGTSTITASAIGCNGPTTATHTVTITNTIGTPIFTIGATSTRCQGATTITYAAAAAGATGMGYTLDEASITGGNLINSSTGAVTYVAGWNGTSIITATATGCNGPTTADHTVTITPTVGMPVFTIGATSTRCQGAGIVSYTATSTNNTSLIYSLDATSTAGGNSINSATGDVTYLAGWTGSTIITASVNGCNGPITSNHVVSITPTVGNISFSLGATSARCIGAGTVTYTASSSNNTGITYALDATSITAGNSINAATGAVTYLAGWSGASTITATAIGCNGPKTGAHVATTNGNVTTPVFTVGASTIRCQGAGTVIYTATANNNTGITYSLDATTAAFPGNSINSSTGAVTYAAGWSGPSTVTAIAAGCTGPFTSIHTVTTTPTVSTPVFSLGATSTRCHGAGTVSYTASSTNSTSLIYSLDAASSTGGNSINSVSGDVTFVASWTGITTITATVTGCSGPKSSNHVVTTNGSVGTPVFALGSTSIRCQSTNNVTYSVSAVNNTGISWNIDGASIAGGNNINAATGLLNYNPAWSGTTTITATATGCNGPTSAIHTVTTTPTVGNPVFTLGATSTRCQGAGTVSYDASSTNNTGITYTMNGAATTGGNTIDATTGVVTFLAGWTGTTIITATATGCNGPKTATHTVTITPTVGNPSFALGATSTRCQGGNSVTYSATATNSVLTYTLDAASITGGNTINSGTGAVAYSAAWNGTTIITVTAAGCNGPKTTIHTVTIIPTVGNPVFALGATSTRCQGGGLVTYFSTATNSTSISYTLDIASTSAGNSINSLTGVVAYTAAWTGTTIITASAAGCNGPKTSTHTVTITPTVSTPVFTGGSTSTICQGATTINYIATAINSTGITYTLDASSISGGNTINSLTGDVTYSAGWSGITTITASAAGCNGPKTANHVVTITPTVGTPVFVLGAQSTRTQGSATITYTATATHNTGITYALDPGSLAGGNSINAATGAVTWAGGWNGLSLITASATGCNGPSTSSHIVTINPVIVQAPLYLAGPGQALNRVDPVSSNIVATLQTGDLSSAATTNVTFTQLPALCASLVIKAQTISVLTYVSITSGTMPLSPNITAQLKYGSTNILTLTNPIYNSSTQLLTWTAVLGADVTVPSGQAIALLVTTAQAGVVFKIQYYSVSKPSRISLFPVSTFINITSFNVYNAPYPGGSIRTSGNPGVTMYTRAVVTTPFGYTDITQLSNTFTPPGNTVNVTCVDSTPCSRTYEYPWTIPAGYGNIAILATAYEGYENIIKNSEVVNFNTCLVCAPVAVNDSAVGAGGAPIIVDVLANDYDPNNNIKVNTLKVFTQPNNGSAFLSNGKIAYLPNGTYAGRDTLTYEICDSTALCAHGQVFFTINPLLIDPCSDATKTHTYFIPYPEAQAYTALVASSDATIPSGNIRTIISLKMPYPGMTIVWDQWEDGYELNPLNPTQSTTQVWGDGNPYNGIAPGYPNDIIPAGGSIVLDNTMPANPRVSSNIFYDGRDKITSSGQISITQVCGEPTWMPVQAIKTNVTSTFDFGQSFTIPLGENFPSQDFKYTSLFIRAENDSTIVQVDKDNNGTFETVDTLMQGESFHVNGGVLVGATVTSNKPVGVELHAGGVDQWSIRNAPIYPASWYSNSYYSPVPTSDNPGDNPKDTAAVMLYNSLNRSITVNWNSGVPASGSIIIPAKSTVRFPLAYTTTGAYKFYNPTGESFTAIEICDSYTPGGGGNDGTTYDWSFNLISEARLTDFATVAWAPGGLDLVAPPGPDVNGNPIWVTPNMNTTLYVKYDGNVSGATGLLSPCGLRYDVAIPLNALNYTKIRNPTTNDQSGIAVYTCNGAKIAAVYGEDPQGSGTGIGVAYWDVGTTIQPFCKQKLIFANDDYGRTMINQAVTLPILLNDFGFLAVVDPTSVSTAGVLQPKHGTVLINPNGTVIYKPNLGYVGKDTFEYTVCSTPTPVVCDNAKVYVDIAVCPAPYNENVIAGQAFLDQNEDGINNDGGTGVAGAKVYLYVDGNCNTTIDPNELKDSVTVDASGTYQFITYPERFVADDFDGPGGTTTCASGNDGNALWKSNWVDQGDPSVGYCQAAANPNAEIKLDAGFSYALRLKNKNVSATRTVDLSGASYAFLTFSYRRKSASLTASHDVIVQASKDGSTFGTVFTIAGDGNTDANYVTIYNQDITSYAAATTYIRFLTNNNVADKDTVYIDNVKVQFLKYPQCYIVRMDPSTIPANYHTTTVLQHSMTATSAQTCLAPFDFGIAKNKIAVSGNLFDDANGLTDNLVNGSNIGVISGATVFAYLVDSLGKVAYRVILNGSGSFLFPSVDIQTRFTCKLSTISLNVGDPAPADPGLPASWIPTGDSYGINNNAGSGNSSLTPSVSVAVYTGTINITGINFGIERLPDTDDKTVNYGINSPGLQYALPALTGSDPEDGLLAAGNTYKITSVPTNAVLFYNGLLISANTVIPSFNPALLLIDPSDSTLMSKFTYAAMDAAGLYDPTPATVTVNWLSILPITSLEFTGKLNGSKVFLNWKTGTEVNSDHFELEKSTNGTNFIMLANVKAKGNSSIASYYGAVDPLPVKGLNYYRLKMIDIDGRYVYSQVIVIRVNDNITLTTAVKPNPFTNSLDVYVTIPHASAIELRLVDVTGKTVYFQTVKGNPGFNAFSINDLSKLSKGTYILQIVSDDSMAYEKMVKQ